MILKANFKLPRRTLAELLHDLGDIPPERVRADPPPGTATEADKNLPENKLCELIDGVLVEKPMGLPESAIGIFIAAKITNFVMERDLGLVTGEAGFFHLPRGQFRAPDVSFTPLVFLSPRGDTGRRLVEDRSRPSRGSAKSVERPARNGS